MADEQRRDEDEVFIADPATYADDLDEPEPPRWPAVVGGVSITIGALGFCCNSGTAAMTTVGSRFMQGAAQQMQGGMPPTLVSPAPDYIASMIISAIWGGVLALAGGVLAARRPAARLLHLVYAAMAVPLTLWSLSVGMRVQSGVAEWIRQNPESDFAQAPGAGGGASQHLGLAVGVLLGLGWPLFCLIWFGLVKRKPEDITGGAEAAA